MKMKILSLLISVFFSQTAHSQITKSYWLVGGSGSFRSSNYDEVGADMPKQSVVQLAGDVGYFVADKLVFGLKPGFTRTTTNFYFGKVKVNAYSIGPFVRYYFLPSGRVLNLFTELGYQFGKSKSNNGFSQSTNEFLGTAGVAAFFNSSVALEFTLGYSSIGYSTPGRQVSYCRDRIPLSSSERQKTLKESLF